MLSRASYVAGVVYSFPKHLSSYFFRFSQLFLSGQTNHILKRLEAFAHQVVGDEYGWQRRFAERLEIRPQQLSNILAGRDPLGAKMRERLANLGCNIEWLMTGKEATIDLHHEVRLTEIPVFEFIRAGTKTMQLKENPSQHIPVVKSNDDTRFGIVVRGNSMDPEVKEGEIVVVSKKAEVASGDLCVVVFDDGETCLRRVHFHDHSVTLTSANAAKFPPAFHKKSEIEYIWRVMQKVTNY